MLACGNCWTGREGGAESLHDPLTEYVRRQKDEPASLEGPVKQKIWDN